MLQWIRFAAVALLFTAGAVTIAISVLGTYRFRFALNRMHSASITDTLGLMFFGLGLMLSPGSDGKVLKLLLVLAFMWISSPISSHLVSRLETETDSELNEHLEFIDKTGEKK